MDEEVDMTDDVLPEAGGIRLHFASLHPGEIV